MGKCKACNQSEGDFACTIREDSKSLVGSSSVNLDSTFGDYQTTTTYNTYKLHRGGTSTYEVCKKCVEKHKKQEIEKNKSDLSNEAKYIYGGIALIIAGVLMGIFVKSWFYAAALIGGMMAIGKGKDWWDEYSLYKILKKMSIEDWAMDTLKFSLRKNASDRADLVEISTTRIIHSNDNN